MSDFNFNLFMKRVQHFLSTEEGLTAAIIAGSFLLSFVIIGIVVLFVRRMFNPKVLRTGSAAPAVIRSQEMTGTRINHHYVYRIEVEVTPESGDPFVATFRRATAPHELHQLTPGTPVTVRYNPERPQKEIALAGLGHGEGEAGDDPVARISNPKELMAVLTEQQAEQTRLCEEGVLSKAIVVERIDLGHRINRIGALCRLRVKVIGPASELYDAEILTAIHVDRLERYAPGAEIPVRVDPMDRTKLAVDSSRSFTSNPGQDPLS